MKDQRNKWHWLLKGKIFTMVRDFGKIPTYHPVISCTCALRNAAIQKRSTKGSQFREDDCTLQVNLFLFEYEVHGV